ncbi:MAG: hypothetical protein NC395_12110, partial [Prevotella sp.]|nr:hypothetical protein [Prevotella sp.]
MSQTKNFGFPLWGDDPPEGATGKDLRDALIGEGADSLANMVDGQLKKVADTQADWDMYDEGDPAFIKNRPCYCYTESGSVTPDDVDGYMFMKRLPIEMPDVFTAEELDGGIISYGVRKVCSEEDEVQSGQPGLLRLPEGSCKIIDASDNELDFPLRGYSIASRTVAGKITSYGRVYILNKKTSERIEIQYYPPQSSARYTCTVSSADTGIYFIVSYN